MIGRRGMLGAAMGVAAASAPLPALAQGVWPDRPVKVVVGFPAGGPTDFPARLLQEPLQRAWGQPLVIENRAGASGILAAEVVAKSAPDGYTLLMGASTHASNPAVYPRLPFDTVRDFMPIVSIYSSPTVLFVAPDSPWHSMQELMAEIRRNPGMVYATSGNGTSGHFAAAMFSLAHHVELTHVAYRGATPAFQDVMTGRVPMTFSTLSGALPLARDGKLRALAICGAQRVEVLPGVPTLEEVGLGIPDTSPWYGFIGPAGLPAALAERIARDVQEILGRPEITRRIIDQGGIVMAEGPAAFARRIEHEMAETAAVARDAHIRSE